MRQHDSLLRYDRTVRNINTTRFRQTSGNHWPALDQLGAPFGAFAAPHGYADRGTIEQRVSRLFQQQNVASVGHLLTVVQAPNDIRSKAFQWAMCKLAWKLDYKSQEYREYCDFLRDMDRYGCIRSRVHA